MARNFKSELEGSAQNGAEPFFQKLGLGRPKKGRSPGLAETIVNYRKKRLSVPDMKILLDAKGHDVSEGFVYRVCDENWFARLPITQKTRRPPVSSLKIHDNFD